MDDHDRRRAVPYLIEQEGVGAFRLIVRETRYNSQNYPIVTAAPVGETFKSSAAARAYAKDNFGAQPGEFATK